MILRPLFSAASPMWRACLILVLAPAAVLAGCASVVRDPPVAAHETARFYWPYAALAADVYQSEGRVDADAVLAAASPWLRDELAQEGNPTRLAAYARRIGADPLALWRHAVARRCNPAQVEATLQFEDGAVRLGQGQCVTTEEASKAMAQRRIDAPEEVNRLVHRIPQSDHDCKDQDGHEPHVPVQLAQQEHGWQRAPELQRSAHPRGWSIFVPDLALDVWRRRVGHATAPEVEYAIVYRGTVGGGGWLSNFRALTALTPLVWDQYRQSELATRSIVRQIYQLHAMSDALFDRAEPTRIRITAVGHSLGAGLAHYMFLRVGEVTSVVGFDPSPVDGAAMIPLAQRPHVMQHRSQPVDRRERDPDAAIFFLFEKGEAISRIAPCHNGPIWGAEGGPVVRCESVDFLRGNIFRQHNMARLACQLFRAQRPQEQATSHEPWRVAR